jgi:hypothetical protein
MDFANAAALQGIQIAARVNTMLSKIHTHLPLYLGEMESHLVLHGPAK